jgi:hypothetical protein
MFRLESGQSTNEYGFRSAELQALKIKGMDFLFRKQTAMGNLAIFMIGRSVILLVEFYFEASCSAQRAVDSVIGNILTRNLVLP